MLLCQLVLILCLKNQGEHTITKKQSKGRREQHTNYPKDDKKEGSKQNMASSFSANDVKDINKAHPLNDDGGDEDELLVTPCSSNVENSKIKLKNKEDKVTSSNSNDGNKKKPTTVKRVVVIGAGPAGLLSCIFLLRRNLEAKRNIKYQVTLVDPGLDYGRLSEEELHQPRHRSWMIGLTSHGLTAVKTIPNLYKEYIAKVGIALSKATFQIGSFKYSTSLSKEEQEKAGFFVDRNYICAGLARYLYDNFGGGNDDDFVTLYETKALFVDSETKSVMIRNSTGNPCNHEIVPLEYDYLLGCDGVRSIVRNSFLTNHRDFEFDIQDAFSAGKALHIPLPRDLDPGHFMILFGCLPNTSIFCIPEPGGMLNFACGWPLNNPCHTDLLSNDPNDVASYFKTNFTAPFELQDYDEFAKLWVQTKLSSVQFTHCNFYHSMTIRALILGDAAHATVPNIGQGMNTALEDALVLDQLLDKFNDDWDLVLPEFSKVRVKEGNALTDLSFHTFSLSLKLQFEILARQNARALLNKIFPEWLVEKEPIRRIGLENKKLSWAYNKVTKYGYLPKSRKINQDLKLQYFEKQIGLVYDDDNDVEGGEETKPSSRKGKRRLYWLLVGVVALAGYAFGACGGLSG